MNVKRYYPFTSESRKLWRKSQGLRKILGEKWFENQSRNQLYWQAHPLFNPIIFNNRSIPFLETALETIPSSLHPIIKRHLKKSVNNEHDFNGFFSEVVIMLRLISKKIDFGYRPGLQGPDFILTSLQNLEVEVTSIQAERWDKQTDTTTRWEMCLPIYKTGLLLQLIWTLPTSQITDSDWIEGFQYFETYVLKAKSIKKDDNITILTKQGKELAAFVVTSAGKNKRIPTNIFPTPQVYGLDLNQEVQKYKSFIVQRMEDKRDQIASNVIVCLDTSGSNWRQSLVKDSNDSSWVNLTTQLEKEIRKPYNDTLICLVLFQRDLSSLSRNIRIHPFGVIPNVNSPFARDNPCAFREALAIFDQ